MTATPAQTVVLICPCCGRTFGEIEDSGNKLVSPAGWSNFRYHCTCLWCHHEWLWLPAREFRVKS